MDGKLTAKVALPVIALVCALALPTGQAMADEEYLCDAVQASKNELPMLKGNCPIGNGLWGKKKPQTSQGLFWVQCGILKKPMPLSKAKSIYQKISTDVWMKKEGREYRCLIGPYEDFATANQEKTKIRQLPAYKDAFVREVVEEGKPVTQKSQASKPKASVKAAATTTLMAAPVATQKTTEPKQEATTRTAMASKDTQPVALATAKVEKAASNDIEIRRQSKLGIHTYVVPYVLEDNNSFYMEYDRAWNRMNYQSAQALCGKLHMRLANNEEWQAILKSGELVKNKWPIHLPYWGDGNQAFFTSGKVTQLKGSSLLNVLCIEP